jgi:hypothetical protein
MLPSACPLVTGDHSRATGKGLFMKRVSIFAAAGAVGCLAIVPVASQAATSAASATVRTAAATASAAYHGTFGHGSRIAASATGVAGLKPVAPSTSIENVQSPRALARFKSPGGPNAAARATGAGAAKVSAASIVSAGKATSAAAALAAKAGFFGPRVRHAFDGLNNLINDRLYGALTPPDQGLCVGPDHTIKGVPDAVWEVVNEVGIETTRSGAVLTPAVALPTLFQDPYSYSDPRCLFDPATQSFYFTQIGFPVATGPSSTLDNTVNDVLVVNSKGAAAYQFDSSLGGNCLGDQPKTGFNNNALIISTDEYCGPTQSDYQGAIVQVISKPELVAEAATVTDAVIGPVSLAGNPVVGLDPAINTGTRTGYLVNSVPYLKDGRNNPLGHTLGLWTLANSASVTTGKGTPVLTGRVLRSEPYAFPVPAPSTGDGSTKVYQNLVITSETVLNPGDSRLSGPVNVTPARDGGVYLWTALATAVAPTGTATRDGAAWFKIGTARQKVVGQGYVAARGASLLCPAVYASRFGPATMVYTITSRTINPSAAFSVLGRPGIQIVGAGSGPHWSFADAPPYNTFRWGDYSFAVPDPVTGGIWMATEYIPRKAEWDGYDNWGTFVFEAGGY